MGEKPHKSPGRALGVAVLALWCMVFFMEPIRRAMIHLFPNLNSIPAGNTLFGVLFLAAIVATVLWIQQRARQRGSK